MFDVGEYFEWNNCLCLVKGECEGKDARAVEVLNGKGKGFHLVLTVINGYSPCTPF